MRNRASVVIIKNGHVALIKRVREAKVYYVFPGGGVEEGETPEVAAIREAYEELGVKVRIKEAFLKVEYDGTQNYFLAEITEGNFGSGAGAEFTDPESNRGIYEPMWVDITKLASLDVLPKEVAVKIGLSMDGSFR